MKHTYTPPYGHANCPKCTKEFDLVAALPTILEKAPHNDTLIYMMCPPCHAAYQLADVATCTSMANNCFVNVKLNHVKPEINVYPWAVTTKLAMELNNFDPVAAIENGHGLTRDQYVDICSGNYEVCVLPGGIRVVISTGTTQETI